jgi:hypothetical protein
VVPGRPPRQSYQRALSHQGKPSLAGPPNSHPSWRPRPCGSYQGSPPGPFPQDPTCDQRERRTVGDHWKPLGSDGVWTKRGQACPACGTAALHVADLGWLGGPADYPAKQAPPDSRLAKESSGAARDLAARDGPGRLLPVVSEMRMMRPWHILPTRCSSSTLSGGPQCARWMVRFG